MVFVCSTLLLPGWFDHQLLSSSSIAGIDIRVVQTHQTLHIEILIWSLAFIFPPNHCPASPMTGNPSGNVCVIVRAFINVHAGAMCMKRKSSSSGFIFDAEISHCAPHSSYDHPFYNPCHPQMKKEIILSANFLYLFIFQSCF